MKEGKELYKKAELPIGTLVALCPVCGSDAELWQYSKDFKNGPIEKLVMCTNGERFGPQDGAMNEGCLLYMPPQDFYRGRIVEAVKFWNEYANELTTQRRRRNLDRARVAMGASHDYPACALFRGGKCTCDSSGEDSFNAEQDKIGGMPYGTYGGAD